MMQQILQDMHIESELLVELSEEQKHVLFYKIREEQVRRWNEWEAREPCIRHDEVRQQRGINWLLGVDGEVWVWVMGEAEGDRPFEDIVEELMEGRARRQAQQEAKELWRVKEAEIEKKFRDAMANEKARFVAGRWKGETDDRKATKQEEEEEDRIREALQRCEQEERQKGKEEIQRTEDRRARELFMSLKQEERRSDRGDDKEWQEQLRRSKAADEEMKTKARWARDEYERQAQRATEKGLVAGLSALFRKTHLNGSAHNRRHSTAVEQAPHNTMPSTMPFTESSVAGQSATSMAVLAGPTPQRRRQHRRHSTPATSLLTESSVWVRPPGPSSREAVIRWYREEQEPRRAGYERNSNSIAAWFHGIISRQQSEVLLQDCAEGSFLVRVSEKIWGYTLSYRSARGFKHFLIDASGESCGFLGVDQSLHATLTDLVDFYREEVITTSGGELLQGSSPQKNLSFDYGGLFL